MSHETSPPPNILKGTPEIAFEICLPKQEELFNKWKVEFPGAKNLFSHFEKNANPDPKSWKVFKTNPDHKTIKIRGLSTKKIDGHYPAVSLKKWDPEDPHRPSCKCLFTLSAFPKEELCNEDNNPAYRYQFDNDSIEIIPIDLRPIIGYRISKEYSGWLKENFIVDFNALQEPA